MYFSDCPINSLEPVEPPDFDASRLRDLSPVLLQDLMNLTFMSDEKLGTNPLYPKAQHFSSESFPPGKSYAPSSDKDSFELIADDKQHLGGSRMTDSKSVNRDDELTDHNADKKQPGLGSIPPRSRSEGDDEALLSVSESLSLPFVSCSDESSQGRTASAELPSRPESLKRTASAFQRANAETELGASVNS